MSPIGMAVIGTGYMGRTYAACLTRHVPDGRLISVWGGKRAPALAEEFGVEADESLADAAGPAGGRGGRHHLAAHRPPAAGRGRGGGRQARLHREADVGLGGRLRRDHRRLRRGRGQAHGQLRHPLPARAEGHEAARRRGRHRRRPDHRDARDVDRVPARGHRRRGDRPGDHPEEGMGVGPGRGLAVPRLGRPRDRRAALADRLRGRPCLRRVPHVRHAAAGRPDRAGPGHDAERRHGPDAHDLRDARARARAQRLDPDRRVEGDHRGRPLRQGQARRRRRLAGRGRAGGVQLPRRLPRPEPARRVRGPGPGLRRGDPGGS